MALTKEQKKLIAGGRYEEAYQSIVDTHNEYIL